MQYLLLKHEYLTFSGQIIPLTKKGGVLTLNITDIRIRRTYQDNRLRALVSVTIDTDLAVHDIKVIEGPERLFVAMPSRKDESGTFRDIAHPITPAARKTLEDSILDAYHRHLEQEKLDNEQAQQQESQSTEQA